MTNKELEKIVLELQKTVNTLVNGEVVKSTKPDFTQIKDGEKFTYNDVEFIRLGEEQGGVLCMATQSIGDYPFDEDNCNNWATSSLRKMLNEDFLSKLNKEDLIEMESDLIADNGDDEYGKCKDYVGLISCDIYRKYRKIIPKFDDWYWTCTPWATPYSGVSNIVRYVNTSGTLYSGNAGYARGVYTSGELSGDYAGVSYGVVPACIFKLQ